MNDEKKCKSKVRKQSNNLFTLHHTAGNDAYVVAHAMTAASLKISRLKISRGTETANDARTVAMLKAVAIDFMVGRNVSECTAEKTV